MLKNTIGAIEMRMIDNRCRKHPSSSGLGIIRDGQSKSGTSRHTWLERVVPDQNTAGQRLAQESKLELKTYVYIDGAGDSENRRVRSHQGPNPSPRGWGALLNSEVCASGKFSSARTELRKSTPPLTAVISSKRTLP